MELNIYHVRPRSGTQREWHAEVLWTSLFRVDEPSLQAVMPEKLYDSVMISIEAKPVAAGRMLILFTRRNDHAGRKVWSTLSRWHAGNVRCVHRGKSTSSQGGRYAESWGLSPQLLPDNRHCNGSGFSGATELVLSGAEQSEVSLTLGVVLKYTRYERIVRRLREKHRDDDDGSLKNPFDGFA